MPTSRVRLLLRRLNDGAGRTAVIAGLAGLLFAGFLLLTPRLTASGSDTTAPVATPSRPSGLPTISEPILVATSPVDIQVTMTTPPTTVPEHDYPAPAGPYDQGLVADRAYDGTIRLRVEAQPAANDGPLSEGDQVTWRFTVDNMSDEQLWAVYVFLEFEGPATCDSLHLLPGGSTDCWITSTEYEGTWTAEAWATAWTLDRIVKDRIYYSYTVSR